MVGFCFDLHVLEKLRVVRTCTVQHLLPHRIQQLEGAHLSLPSQNYGATTSLNCFRNPQTKHFLGITRFVILLVCLLVSERATAMFVF